MKTPSSIAPDWNRLFDFAVSQEGLFSAQQAAAAGYSAQLLAHHVAAGRMTRVRRGVYRLVHYPAGEHEDLVAVWLWTERVGVFSHETALSLHDLSDVLPHKVHVTLPTNWRHRRLRVPDGVVVHFGNVSEAHRCWYGPVPTTTVERTLEDCERDFVSPEIIEAAWGDAIRRGVVSAHSRNPLPITHRKHNEAI